MSKERPILFSAPMVRAILSGQKTQTRRIIKQATGPSLSVDMNDELGMAELSWLSGDGPGYEVHETIKCVDCPYGKRGDKLWLRENFSGPWCMEAQDGIAALPPSQWPAESDIWYWADGNPTYGNWTRPRPSIHMPRWASRITLEVTGVRVERLQDISEANAQAEGADALNFDNCGTTHRELFDMPLMDNGTPYRNGFALLWESINGDGSWTANPWVWVVEFRRVE